MQNCYLRFYKNRKKIYHFQYFLAIVIHWTSLHEKRCVKFVFIFLGLNSFLVCCEMVIAVFAVYFAFPVSVYTQNQSNKSKIMILVSCWTGEKSNKQNLAKKFQSLQKQCSLKASPLQRAIFFRCIKWMIQTHNSWIITAKKEEDEVITNYN